MTASFLNGFKIFHNYRSTHSWTNILGLFWSKKLDVKFSRVFIRHKNTH